MTNLLYWLAAILMFGVLIMLHEFGHFIAARMTGVTVLEFAVGFGPKILSRQAKSGVVYSLRALPLGGYCRFVGDETDDDHDRPDAFSKAKIWKRAFISVAGVIMNLLTGLVLLFVLCAAIGLPTADGGSVVSVEAGMPAAEVGLVAGDRIVAINGQETMLQAQISEAIGATEVGSPITFTIERDSALVDIPITPQWVEAENRQMIGITYSQATRPVRMGFVDSIKSTFVIFGDLTHVLYDLIKDLVTTGEGIDDLSGPIGVVTQVKEQTQNGGLFDYVYLAAIISIQLGLFNLLPIPGLDGSKLVFLLIEKIRGKPLDPKYEGIVTLIGFALLMGLMVFAFYQDIVRLIQR